MPKMYTVRTLWKAFYQEYLPFRSFRKLMMTDLVRSKIIKVGTLVRCYEDSADWLFADNPSHNPRLTHASDDLTV